jgi:hypothetical protein
MNGEYFRITLMIMFLSFLGTVYLEPALKNFHMVELLVIIVGLIFAFLVLYGIATGKRWAWPAATIFFSLALINTSLIWAYHTLSAALIGTYFFEIIGLLLAFANLDIFDLQQKTNEIDIRPPEAAAIPAYDANEGVEPEVVRDYEIRKTKNVFEPGTFIASKTGKKYHVPKCDWAEKINPNRRIWFSDAKEAKKEGYKACDCVK